MTNWLESEVADALTGQGTLAASGGSLKIRFHTADPTEVGTSNEVTGGGYPTGGVAITFSDRSGFVNTSATIASITNVPAATIAYFSIQDGTNTWAYGPYSQTWTAGRTIEFTGTEVTLTWGGGLTEFAVQKISDALRNVGGYINTTPKAALWTTTPPTDGTVGANEAADATYVRQTVTYGAESGGVITNSAAVEFGAYTGAEVEEYAGVIDENETPDKVTFTSRILGADFITNGTFAADTDWTKGTGWTISGGNASSDGTQAGDSDLEQDQGTNFLNDSEIYEFTFTVSGYSAGNVTAVVGGAEGTDRSADGTYTEYITCGATDDKIIIRADLNFVGNVDDVVVKPAHAKMAASEKLRFPASNFTFTAT